MEGSAGHALPSHHRQKKEELKKGAQGARDDKAVAVPDPFALLYLTEKLPSASWLLAGNTVRASCCSLFKGKDCLPSSGGVLLLTPLF